MHWLKLNKKAAFTLAEVLITLGVIGIVAEMTIPTLMNNVTNAALVSGFLKDYSILQQASRMLINDNNGSIANVYATAQDFSDALSKYLKVSKTCADGAANGICWMQPTALKTLYGSNFTGNYNDNSPTFILADGSIVRIYDTWYASNCSIFPRTLGGIVEGACAVIHMDVNGFKPPNQLGRDIYEMIFYSNSGIMPNGTQGSADDYRTNPNMCSTTYSGVDSGCGCAGKVMAEKAINY